MNKKINQNELKYLGKLTGKKYRKLNKQVIVEGENLVTQLLSNNCSVKQICVTEHYSLTHQEFCLKYSDILRIIDLKDIKNVTETESPQAIIALVDYSFKPIIKYDKILYLDGIQDPGNLGTIIRTVLAAELDGLVLSPDC